MLSVDLAGPSDGERWNAFVHKAAPDHFAYLWEWREIISSTFAHEPVYLMALYGEEVVGVLPLFLVRSKLFGGSLVSVPYLNAGGVLTDDVGAFKLLIEGAEKQKAKFNVRYVEFRARELDARYRSTTGFPLPVRTHKIAMKLPLPQTEEELMKGFDKKLRSQIKRPAKDGVICKVTQGKDAAIDDFYKVFAENMRDLGTPVYPKKLWTTLFNTLPETPRCIVAYKGDVPVAAGVTIGFEKDLEIPWASSLRRFNSLSANMLLYSEAMAAAIRDGYRTFDFGRSNRDSGTFKFKAQWGAEPKMLYWYYIAIAEDVPDVNPSSAKFSILVAIWRKLPLAIANAIGPWLTRSIP